MSLPISAFYASLLAILVLVLTINVIRLRRSRRVGIGTGGDAQLARAVRVHANAIENIPLILLLLALLEASSGSAWLLHAAGGSLLLGRILHAWGLSSSEGTSIGRLAGMLLTWVALLSLAIPLLIIGLRAL